MLKRSRHIVRTWWAWLGDELLDGCELSGQIAARRAGWRADARSMYCARCGASIGEGAATEDGCPHCRSQRIVWDGAWRLTAYREPTGRWIRQMKFSKMWTWGPWFGKQLAGAASGTLGGERTVVTAVPLHWRRRWRRGYDQAWLIAEAMAKAASVPTARLLQRRKRTHSQSKMKSAVRRAANVKNAFAIKPVDLTGWTVWLVDDVKTTGSTLAQCAKLLKAAGAERVYIAVVAVADPKGADFQVN